MRGGRELRMFIKDGCARTAAGWRSLGVWDSGGKGTMIKTEVDLLDVCRPMDECLVIKPGRVEEAAILELESHHYEQAPVRDPEREGVYGLVTTAYLRLLHEAHLPLRAEDPIISSSEAVWRVEQKWVQVADLESVVAAVAKRGAVLAIQEDGDRAAVIGLLTRSDLNGVAVRVALYEALVIMETTLTACILGWFDDPESWIRLLNEESKVRILGYCELARRAGQVDSPIGFITLPQVLQILAKTPDILTKLGFKSRGTFEDATGIVVHLRNRVMHATRPLVIDRLDAEFLVKAIRTLDDTLDLVNERLGFARASKADAEMTRRMDMSWPTLLKWLGPRGSSGALPI